MPIKFNFAVLISGFKSLCKPHEIYYDEKITLPTLHVYGEGDKIIPTSKRFVMISLKSIGVKLIFLSFFYNRNVR